MVLHTLQKHCHALCLVQQVLCGARPWPPDKEHGGGGSCCVLWLMCTLHPADTKKKNTPKSHPLPYRSFPLWLLWGGRGEAFTWRGARWPWEQAVPRGPPRGAGRGGWRAPGTLPRSRWVTNSCNQPDTMSVLAASSEAVAASSRGHRVPVLSAEGICLLCRGARREIKM